MELAAPGFGTATLDADVMLPVSNTLIPSPRSCSRNGTGPNGWLGNPRLNDTSIMLPTASNFEGIFSSTK